MTPLVTAGASDDVAQELRMPIGPQALEDVEESMPSRPVTFEGPGTPDPIVLDQHSLTHFPSQPWCKVCVESRGRDSPHREQSKIDTAVPQFQVDYGHMGIEALCRLRVSSWEPTPLLEPYTRQWCLTPRRWACSTWLLEQPSGCVTWGIHSTQKINDISSDHLISHPSTNMKKHTQRADDSILLRHMDDVVGTGPEDISHGRL